MTKNNNISGFTLIEMLLVMVIMGIMLAVIVPRAWRANVDSKYTLVRQNCTELVSYASSWAEQGLLAQDDDCGCSMVNYYSSLAGNKGAPKKAGCWIAQPKGNWTDDTNMKTPKGRKVGGSDAAPETTVSGIIDPSKGIRNPFNGASVFVAANKPSSANDAVPGAICCVCVADSTFWYFALLFQGTDSTTGNPTAVGGPTLKSSSFYAGQSGTLAGVRNGIFMARLN